MIRALVTGLAVVSVLYLAVLVLAYIFQRSLLYFPDQHMVSEEQLADTGFQYAAVKTSNGNILRSLWRPSDNLQANQKNPVIIHLHGNGGSVAGRLSIYQEIAKDGAGVLAVGYPGYGGNPGVPDEEGLYAAGQANYDWLIKQGYAPEEIVIVGQSLGTGVATWLASENEAAGLILEAAFTGMDDMAQRQFPYLPAKLLIKDRYRNHDRIGQIDMPFSWIHGTDDELIPFAMGQSLFDAARQPKQSYPIKNGGHNDLWMRGIGRIIRSEAVRFVKA